MPIISHRITSPLCEGCWQHMTLSRLTNGICPLQKNLKRHSNSVKCDRGQDTTVKRSYTIDVIHAIIASFQPISEWVLLRYSPICPTSYPPRGLVRTKSKQFYLCFRPAHNDAVGRHGLVSPSAELQFHRYFHIQILLLSTFCILPMMCQTSQFLRCPTLSWWCRPHMRTHLFCVPVRMGWLANAPVSTVTGEESIRTEMRRADTLDGPIGRSEAAPKSGL